VEPQEGERVVLLLIMGFFMGIFLATYSVASETLFLGMFDEQKDLPMAFLISGGVGLVVTYIFNFFLTRIRFTTLILIFTFLIALVVIFFTVGFHTAPDVKPVIYAVFVSIGPFAAIVLLIFWGIFGRIFDLREAKRIIGSIDTGMLLASIFALFSIPFILRLLTNTYELFIISSLSVFLVLIAISVIALKYNLNKIPGQNGHEKKKIGRVSYVKLLKNRYTLLMSGFVVISMVCVAFVDFSFLNVASLQFPAERDLANFLALFEGMIVVFSFLFQTFATDKIIAIYGLRTALIANPLLLAGLTVVAILVGSLFGYTAEATQFVVFFMAISMSKLFLDSLKDALDGPSFKLYFLPISSEIKFDVQTKIEGVIHVFAGLLAGSFILLISNVGNFNLLSLSFFLVPLVVGWYFVTDKMYRKYRDTLKETLEKNKGQNAQEEDTEETSEQVLEDYASSENPEMVLMVMNVMEKIDPEMFDRYLQESVESVNNDIREYSQAKINKVGINPAVEEGSSSLTKKLATESVEQSGKTESLQVSAKDLSRKSKSPDFQERIDAAKILRRLFNDENEFVLIELLRDVNLQVKLAAINTARHVKSEESWQLLIDLLGTINYCHHAESALIACGDKVIPVLEKAFHKSGQKPEIMFRIVRIYGRIGSPMAMKALWDKIDIPDKAIHSEILQAHKNNNYQIQEYKLKKLRELLENELSYTLWNLAAFDEVADVEINSYLRQAMEVEIAHNYDRIYLLLGLIYDPHSVNLVRKNIDTGTTEGIAFGMELLDIFIATDLKALLFPVLDDLPIRERLEKLQDDFPRENYSNVEVLYELINRNYNQINRWTKACAIFSLSQIPKIKIDETVLAQLFNPDPLLREIAAWFVYSKNREIYHSVTRRINDDIKRELDSTLLKASFVNQVTLEKSLRFEKILYLMTLQTFEKIDGYILADIVDMIGLKTYKAGDFIFDNKENMSFDMIIMLNGKVQVEGENGFYQELLENNVLSGVELSPEISGNMNGFVLEDSQVFHIERGKLFELISRKEHLARRLIRNKEKRMITQTVDT